MRFAPLHQTVLPSLPLRPKHGHHAVQPSPGLHPSHPIAAPQLHRLSLAANINRLPMYCLKHAHLCPKLSDSAIRGKNQPTFRPFLASKRRAPQPHRLLTRTTLRCAISPAKPRAGGPAGLRSSRCAEAEALSDSECGRPHLCTHRSLRPAKPSSRPLRSVPRPPLAAPHPH